MPKLQLVILYNARRNVYTVCDHNLTVEEAQAKVPDLSAKSLNALVVDQRKPHAEPDPQLCRECRHSVEHASGLTPKPKFERMDTDMSAQKRKEPPAAPPIEESTGRKPWKKKTPVEFVLAQIEKAREDVEQRQVELNTARRQLQKLEEVKKLLESE
jgi:hypothetical protein